MNRSLSPEQIVERKERRAVEGKANMARYREQQQRALDRMARLRAQRLALPPQTSTAPTKTSVAKENPARRSLPGLHQGVRGSL